MKFVAAQATKFVYKGKKVKFITYNPFLRLGDTLAQFSVLIPRYSNFVIKAL